VTEEKMEGSCSTGQSPQRAVVPVEEEEENQNTHFMVKIFFFFFFENRAVYDT
jgi:hypothetical protein